MGENELRTVRRFEEHGIRFRLLHLKRSGCVISDLGLNDVIIAQCDVGTINLAVHKSVSNGSFNN